MRRPDRKRLLGVVIPAGALLAGIALLLVDRPGGAALREGLRAAREGRHAEAAAALADAERRAGAAATPELLYDRALAALAAGDIVTAEASAEKLAARGAGPWAPVRDFLLGNAAYARCEKAEAVTFGPKPAPAAFDLAIAEGRQAAAWWRRALEGRAEWPEARRNVERAELKVAGLEKRRAEAEAQRRPESRPPRSDPSTSGPKPPPGKAQAAPRLAPLVTQLANDPARRVLEKLAAKEKEKLALRRAERQARGTLVEKDW